MQKHIPVLLQEVIRESHIKKGDVYVDGTLGAGGHAKALFEKVEKSLTILGFDKDVEAQKIARTTLEEVGAHPTIVHASFSQMKEKLSLIGVTQVDVILLDLGISSMHVDTDTRGFTFMKDQPLHMNMNQTGELTAFTIINTWGEETLATIIFGFGEERYSRRIAKKIVESRKIAPIKTTFELVDIIQSAVPVSYQKGKIHPATRTFQALRIAVNEELTELEQVIPDAVSMLKKGGRFLIISFHSLEDRIVKQQFKLLESHNLGQIVTKKPIIATQEELSYNPRARSAKLRVFQRV